jgi:hypothetical protein
LDRYLRVKMVAWDQYVNYLVQGQNDRYLPCHLGDLISQPFGYWPNALTTRLPAPSLWTEIEPDACSCFSHPPFHGPCLFTVLRSEKEFHDAAKRNDTDKMRELMKKGVDIKANNKVSACTGLESIHTVTVVGRYTHTHTHARTHTHTHTYTQ